MIDPVNPSVLPPVVAGVVALAISATRRLSSILLESSAIAPTPRTLSLYVLGGRFASFVLVYGLSFGIAYWVGAHREDANADGTLALATGAVAALAYLVGTSAVLWSIEAQQGVFVRALVTGGSSVAVGVQLAVVTFAGLALSGR